MPACETQSWVLGGIGSKAQGPGAPSGNTDPASPPSPGEAEADRSGPSTRILDCTPGPVIGYINGRTGSDAVGRGQDGCRTRRLAAPFWSSSDLYRPLLSPPLDSSGHQRTMTAQERTGIVQVSYTETAASGGPATGTHLSELGIPTTCALAVPCNWPTLPTRSRPKT